MMLTIKNERIGWTGEFRLLSDNSLFFRRFFEDNRVPGSLRRKDTDNSSGISIIFEYGGCSDETA